MGLELTGKVALVTGASCGIGRAIAEGLAAEGARLVIAARGAEALEETKSRLERAGAEVLAVPTDVGDDASVAALVEQARKRFGPIDILISNASALAVMGDRASWDASQNVDVMGAVRLVEAVLPIASPKRSANGPRPPTRSSSARCHYGNSQSGPGWASSVSICRCSPSRSKPWALPGCRSTTPTSSSSPNCPFSTITATPSIACWSRSPWPSR